MVYESDFYTTRRPYRPTSSYSVTTPRHYVVVDRDPLPRRADEQYSYSYSSTTERSTGSGLPQRSSYSNTVERRSGGGPGGYSYTSERSSSLGGPGGYSYTSTASGRLPYGTNYRHYHYRV
ncbi:fau protein isoform 1-T1 [Aphomia sociella]